MRLLDGDEQLGDIVWDLTRSAAIGPRLGQQRIEAAGAVALEPVADGLGGHPGAGGAGDDVIALGLLGNLAVQALGAGLQTHKVGNHPVAEQGDGVAVVVIGTVHDARSSVNGLGDRERATLASPLRGIWPPRVLGRSCDLTAHPLPGTQSERWGHSVEDLGGHTAKHRQHRLHAEQLAEGGKRCRARGEALWRQTTNEGQARVHRTHPPACPAHRTGQLYLGAQPISRRFQARRLLHRPHHRLELVQRAR